MKYIKTHEEYNYNDAVQLVKSEAPIKSYLLDKYPKERKLMGRYGHGFSKTGLSTLIRFAKKQNDQTLIKLINTHLDFCENMKMRKEAENYNL